MLNKNIFMQEAIAEAMIAYNINEVPVGAVIVVDDKVVGRGHNIIETKSTVLHAEINAIADAEQNLGDIRFHKSSIYITCEPCIMCAGAIILSRINNVYFGVKNDKFGGVVSLENIFDNIKLNHKVEYEGGVLADDISIIMKRFFQEVRGVKS